MFEPDILLSTKHFHNLLCLVSLLPTPNNLPLQVHLDIQILEPLIMWPMTWGICNRWHNLKVLIKSSLAMVKVCKSTQLVLVLFCPTLTLTHLPPWIISYLFLQSLRILSLSVSFVVIMESIFCLHLINVLSNASLLMRCYLMMLLELMDFMSFHLNLSNSSPKIALCVLYCFVS